MKQSKITTYFVPIKMKSKRKIQSLITDYIEIKDNNQLELEQQKKNKPIVYGYDSETDSWHCLECGEDMGRHNPRQLCGKTHCYNKCF